MVGNLLSKGIVFAIGAFVAKSRSSEIMMVIVITKRQIFRHYFLAPVWTNNYKNHYTDPVSLGTYKGYP